MVAALVLSACAATGPSMEERGLSEVDLGPDETRIIVYRPRNFHGVLHPQISINGTPTNRCQGLGVFILTVPPGMYTLSDTQTGYNTVQVDTRNTDTVYVRCDIASGLATLDLVSPETGARESASLSVIR